METRKLRKHILHLITCCSFAFALLLLTLTSEVQASNYGEGTFGLGDFGTGETVTSTNNNSSSTSTSGGGSSTCGNIVSSGVPDLFEIRTNKNTATLYFSPPTGPYSSFYITFSSKPSIWEYGVEFNQGYSGGAIKYTINMLKPNTKYYFMVRAGNGCATGNWSNSMRASTTKTNTTKIYYKNILIPVIAATNNLKKNLTNSLSKKPLPTSIPTTVLSTPSSTTVSQTTTKPQPLATPKPQTKSKTCFLWIFCW